MFIPLQKMKCQAGISSKKQLKIATKTKSHLKSVLKKLRIPDGEHPWRASMASELRALKNRGCWRQVRIPSGGVRLIKSKFVYKIKKDWRGHVTKRKSRLVVQGFLQQAGVDFNETYAPVAKAATFRLMLTLTKTLKLHLHQLDVDNAFPYADLDEDVYMTPPLGTDLPEGYCLKLLKSLYGLKQAPRNWNKNIVDQIKSL